MATVDRVRAGAFGLLALCAAARSAGPSPCTGEAARLLFLAHRDGSPGSEDLAQRLAALGPAAVPDLFAILDVGRIPLAERPDDSVPLDPSGLGAVLGAFGRLSPTAVRSHLASFDRDGMPWSTREAALLVLGEMGRSQDIRLLAELGAPADPQTAVAPAARDGFDEAHARNLERDPGAGAGLRDAYDRAHPGLRAGIVEAVRRGSPPNGLQVLAGLLGYAREIDPLLLAAIAHLADEAGGCSDPLVLSGVRAYLDGGDPRLCQAAALAARRLGDTRALPELIRLLRHPDPNVRRSSDLALRAIAGRDFHGDARRWELWYAGEERWWRVAAPRLITDLERGDPPSVARALNEVGEHRIFRRELELALIEALGQEDADIVALACTVIGQLGSRGALPELERLAVHGHPRVAGAARGALASLLGPESGPGRPFSAGPPPAEKRIP